jgi:hypothetical protein
MNAIRASSFAAPPGIVRKRRAVVLCLFGFAIVLFPLPSYQCSQNVVQLLIEERERLNVAITVLQDGMVAKRRGVP